MKPRQCHARLEIRRWIAARQGASCPARGKPYWRSIGNGLHIGYRRLRGTAGTWSTRVYKGEDVYEVELLGSADDLLDADGVSILNFWQAQEAAQQRFRSKGKSAGPYTVTITLATLKPKADHRSRLPTHALELRS